MKTISFEDFLNEQLKDPKFKKIYEETRFKYFLLASLSTEYTKRGLTVSQLAKMSELSYNTVYNALMLCDCKLSTVSKLVNALGLEFEVKKPNKYKDIIDDINPGNINKDGWEE